VLNAIKAVIRCTAPNDAVPVLTHVAISNGELHAFNGRMYARIKIESNPFELDAICVRADMLLAALTALGESKAKAVVDMEHGTLQFDSKRYRARIPVRPIEDFYIQEKPMRRKAVTLTSGVIDALSVLRIIVGDNPMLPWTHGYLIEKRYIAATNASTMAKMDVSCGIAPTIITAEYANEVLMQAATPTHMLSEGGKITTWFDNGVILSSVIIDGAWPKAFETVIDPLMRGAKFSAIPEGFMEALQSVVPFSSDEKIANVTLNGDKIELISSETASASATIDGLKAPPCAFNVNQLRAVRQLATEWDLSKFPMVPFRNKKQGISGGFAGVSR
jgi:DNA polymerase III sliding clamp (beta) subunit (PCNA family)